VASPATVALVARRLRASRLKPLPLGEHLERRDHRIWLAPAGHVLGAAQIVVEGPDGRRLVYTGDFSVRPRPTIEAATPIRADILITECTFGLPQYVFPSDDEIRERICSFVERALAAGAAPVVLGYALGKAQEAMALLTGLGYPVVVHSGVARLAEIYQAFGVDLGPYTVYEGQVPAGHVLVAPPNVVRTALPLRHRTLYLSGWALDRSAKYRLGVDEAIPLSDHADFPELVAFVQQVQPTTVYTTHGPAAFADHLRRLGFDAQHLGTHQPALF
jgi:Cft2 family RNA processing exonuclease